MAILRKWERFWTCGSIKDIKQSESEVKTFSKLKDGEDIYGDLISHDTEEGQQTSGCSYR